MDMPGMDINQAAPVEPLRLRNKQVPKSVLARQGSKSKLKGPREFSPRIGFTQDRPRKVVTFDRTDEVIHYDMLTPEPDSLDASQFGPIGLEENSEHLMWGQHDVTFLPRPLPQVPESRSDSALSSKNGTPITYQQDLSWSREAVPSAESSRVLHQDSVTTPVRYHAHSVQRTPNFESSPPQPSQAPTVPAGDVIQSPNPLYESIERGRMDLEDRVEAVMAADVSMLNFPRRQVRSEHDPSWEMIQETLHRKQSSTGSIASEASVEGDSESYVFGELPAPTRQESLIESNRRPDTQHVSRSTRNNYSQPQSQPPLQRTHSSRKRGIMSILSHTSHVPDLIEEEEFSVDPDVSTSSVEPLSVPKKVPESVARHSHGHNVLPAPAENHINQPKAEIASNSSNPESVLDPDSRLQDSRLLPVSTIPTDHLENTAMAAPDPSVEAHQANETVRESVVTQAILEERNGTELLEKSSVEAFDFEPNAASPSTPVREPSRFQPENTGFSDIVNTRQVSPQSGSPWLDEPVQSPEALYAIESDKEHAPESLSLMEAIQKDKALSEPAKPLAAAPPAVFEPNFTVPTRESDMRVASVQEFNVTPELAAASSWTSPGESARFEKQHQDNRGPKMASQTTVPESPAPNTAPELAVASSWTMSDEKANFEELDYHNREPETASQRAIPVPQMESPIHREPEMASQRAIPVPHTESPIHRESEMASQRAIPVPKMESPIHWEPETASQRAIPVPQMESPIHRKPEMASQRAIPVPNIESPILPEVVVSPDWEQSIDFGQLESNTPYTETASSRPREDTRYDTVHSLADGNHLAPVSTLSPLEAPKSDRRDINAHASSRSIQSMAYSLSDAKVDTVERRLVDHVASEGYISTPKLTDIAASPFAMSIPGTPASPASDTRGFSVSGHDTWRPPIAEHMPPIDEQRPPIDEQRPPIDEQRPPIDEQWPSEEQKRHSPFVGKTQHVDLELDSDLSESEDPKAGSSGPIEGEDAQGNAESSKVGMDSSCSFNTSMAHYRASMPPLSRDTSQINVPLEMGESLDNLSADIDRMMSQPARGYTIREQNSVIHATSPRRRKAVTQNATALDGTAKRPISLPPLAEAYDSFKEEKRVPKPVHVSQNGALVREDANPHSEPTQSPVRKPTSELGSVGRTQFTTPAVKDPKPELAPPSRELELSAGVTPAPVRREHSVLQPLIDNAVAVKMEHPIDNAEAVKVEHPIDKGEAVKVEHPDREKRWSKNFGDEAAHRVPVSRTTAAEPAAQDKSHIKSPVCESFSFNERRVSSRLTALPQERGRLFLRLDEVASISLPGLTQKNAGLTVTIDNGVHCITTPSQLMTSNTPIGEEFALIVQDQEAFVCTVRASWTCDKNNNKGDIGKAAKKMNRLSRLLTKRQIPAESKASQAEDTWGSLVSNDGTFGRCLVNFDTMRRHAFGTPYRFEVVCHNDWAAARSPQVDTCVLKFEAMYVPRMSRSEILPQTMDAAAKEIAKAQKSRSVDLAGLMTQNGGDCAAPSQRYYILDGNSLIAHSRTSRRPRVSINLRKATSVVPAAHNDHAFTIHFKNGTQLEFVDDSSVGREKWVDKVAAAMQQPHLRSNWVNLVLYGDSTATSPAALAQVAPVA